MRSIVFLSACVAAACSLSTAVKAADAAKNLPKYDVNGVIDGPDGKACAGAHVLWIDSREPNAEPLVATTDAEGKFHFDADKAWRSAAPFYIGYAVAKAAGFGLLGAQVRDSKPVTITLTPPTRLHARFVDAAGTRSPARRSASSRSRSAISRRAANSVTAFSRPRSAGTSAASPVPTAASKSTVSRKAAR